MVTFMFKVTKKAKCIAFEISSDTRLVERLIMESQEFLREPGIENSSRFKTVLRETLGNAIEHGNRNIIEKKVACSVKLLGNKGHKRVKIEVMDEGPGFDYKNLDMTFPENPKHFRNIGFPLIHACADEIEFNESGSRITVTCMRWAN